MIYLIPCRVQVLASSRVLISTDELGCVMLSQLPWPEASLPIARWPAFSITLDKDLEVSCCGVLPHNAGHLPYLVLQCSHSVLVVCCAIMQGIFRTL